MVSQSPVQGWLLASFIPPAGHFLLLNHWWDLQHKSCLSYSSFYLQRWLDILCPMDDFAYGVFFFSSSSSFSTMTSKCDLARNRHFGRFLSSRMYFIAETIKNRAEKIKIMNDEMAQESINSGVCTDNKQMTTRRNNSTFWLWFIWFWRRFIHHRVKIRFFVYSWPLTYTIVYFLFNVLHLLMYFVGYQ